MKHARVAITNHESRITNLDSMKLLELQQRINYEFRDKKLLEEALTHSSVVHETGGANKRDNQRLEYLGDAVLQVILTDWLYRLFPNANEGDLTRLRSHLANRHMLYRLAHQMSLGEMGTQPRQVP